MNQLTDFKPLAHVGLPGLGALDCSGLILIVGPNSSGKSQFLHDLHQRIRGEPRTLVVANEITIRKPDRLDLFLECLQREGYLAKVRDPNDQEQFRPLTTFVGTGEAAPPVTPGQVQQWFDSFRVGDPPSARRRIDFLTYFGRLIVTALFLERRLVSVNPVPMFDFETQPPQNDFHALFVDDSAKSALLTEIRATFSRTIWPDASRGNILSLRVSDESESPSAEQRLSPKTVSKYRTIETEGDGLKSYVATCIALLLGRRPVCLVDEPELCLHPPQAHSLGRFVGRYGASPARATFVATHSSHVLRGVIETAEKLQIVRLTRNGGVFEGHRVPADVLTEILARPTVRAETILDGIFAQAVAIVEADGDRMVYQAVIETLAEECRLDVHFASVGGTGGIADTCRLYRALRIPVAVIADLDLLTDTERLRRIVSELMPKGGASNLASAASAVAEAIRRIPPNITAQEVRTRLGTVTALPMEWSKEQDLTLRTELQDLIHHLDRMRRLKSGGIASLPKTIADQTSALIKSLATIGIFVVPVGELEGWLADKAIAASKRSKWAWANEAALKVRSLGPQPGDVWDFMRTVARYMTQSLENRAESRGPATMLSENAGREVSTSHSLQT